MLFENAEKSAIETFLSYKDRHHDTPSLLLIKKWGDFFLQNFPQHQQKPHLHFQLSRLNLEIAIQARKERNLKLASRHLVQHLGCQNGLVEYFESIGKCLRLFTFSKHRGRLTGHKFEMAIK